MGKKVLIVATVVKTHIMQFHIPTMKMLHDEGWTVDVAARNDYENPNDCSIPYCDHYYDVSFERSPFKPGNLQAYRQLRKIINEGHYDVVHCHTPVGGVLGRLAARKVRKKGTKVFYTAHGFHFYKGAPILNWLLWYPVEKICAHFTDTLITINKEDFKRANDFFKAKKITFVPGMGIDVEKYKNCIVDFDEKRKEIGIPKEAFLLISVGELRELKNQRLVINAMHSLNDSNLFYIIVGQGEKYQEYKELIEKYHLESNIKLLGYRLDVPELLKISDCFVHPSTREGLGMAPLEAMASGLPLIFTDIRGLKDYAIDNVNGCCVAPFSIKSMEDCILKIHDKKFRSDCILYNKTIVVNYDIKNSMMMIKKLYQ